MTEYVLLIILLSVLCAYGRTKWALYMAFIMLLVIGGMRDVSVGTDSKNYMEYFEQFLNDPLNLYHTNEPLYLGLQFVAMFAGWGYGGLQFTSMFIMLVALFYVTYKWSVNPVYSILCYVLLYFFFYSFNTTRQFLAIPFVLLSYYNLINKRWIYYATCVLIAAMFHYVAIVSVIAIPLYYFNIRRDVWVLLLIGSFVFGITPLAQFVTNIIAQYTAFGNYASESLEFRNSMFSLSRFLLNIYTICLLYWLNYDEDDDFRLSLLAVGVCMLNLFSFQPVIGRLCQFFTIIQIFIIPTIPIYERENKLVNSLAVGSIVYMAVVWLYLISGNIGEIVPWKLWEGRLFSA